MLSMRAPSTKCCACGRGFGSGRRVRLGPKLGEGTFGTVFKGTYRNRTVAIKTVSPNQIQHDTMEDFKNEILVMAPLRHDNLVNMGGVQYSPTEHEFAQTIRKTLIAPRRDLGSEQTVAPYRVRQSMGSTDVGDVSWLVPTVGFTTATWVPGTPAHSWQAVAAGGMSIGHKGMGLAFF